MILDWSKMSIGHRWARSHHTAVILIIYNPVSNHLSQLSELINCTSGDIPSKLTLRSVRCSFFASHCLRLQFLLIQKISLRQRFPWNLVATRFLKGPFPQVETHPASMATWPKAGMALRFCASEATIFLYADAVHKETIQGIRDHLD